MVESQDHGQIRDEAVRDQAVTALYREHWPGLLRLAFLTLGDRAASEDVVQEAFTGLYRRWWTISDRTKAVAYVRSAVLNGSRSVLRRRKVSARFTSAEGADWSAEHDVLIGEDRLEVLRALQRLPARRREVLILRFYFDSTDSEIAETLGISPGTVRSTIHRGLAALERHLRGER